MKANAELNKVEISANEDASAWTPSRKSSKKSDARVRMEALKVGEGFTIKGLDLKQMRTTRSAATSVNKKNGVTIHCSTDADGSLKVWRSA